MMIEDSDTKKRMAHMSSVIGWNIIRFGIILTLKVTGRLAGYGQTDIGGIRIQTDLMPAMDPK